jgi:hypothetical protein
MRIKKEGTGIGNRAGERERMGRGWESGEMGEMVRLVGWLGWLEVYEAMSSEA